MNHQNLFKRIDELIPTIDGWCSVDRACDLAALVLGLKPMTTVVIGVWGGRDTFALALAHQANGFGRCFAIDPWKAVASVEGQTPANADWWKSQERHDIVYSRFIHNKRELGLDGFIEVNRAKASAIVPPENIGLLIVDGNHGPESITDVDRFAPAVAPGGIVYCDDIGWSGGSVAEAVRRLQAMGFQKLYDQDTGAFFQRIK